MISSDIKDRMDPEVYEFYKPALEGRGFSMPFSAKDIPLIRADEVERHAANTEIYPCNTIDLMIDRDDADPLPVRVYQPGNGEATSEKSVPDSKKIFGIKNDESGLPVILYFHGGGFVMGNIYDHDPLCGKLADACHAIVISVDYRLAPENPFPACIDDAVLAANWAYEHAEDLGGDPGKLMAGGDSSGANISAALALMSLKNDAPSVPEISYLILFYGVYGCYDLESSPSAKEFGNGDFVLPNDMMMSCMDLYLPKDKYPDGIYTDDPRLAPGRNTDLTGFPPSVIVSAEFDPLRDDSEEFAKRLKNAGCDTEMIRMDGMMHGFILYWQNFHRAKELIEEIGDKVRKL